MFREICSVSYRKLINSSENFKKLDISLSDSSLEITDEHTNAGKLYKYTFRALLKSAATFGIDTLQFRVGFSDAAHIIIGNEQIAVYPTVSSTSDGDTVAFEYTDYHPPVYN